MLKSDTKEKCHVLGPMLSGKKALIIGAGSVGVGWGNGRATVSVFLEEGAKIAGVDRDLVALKQTEADAGFFEKFVCDVTDLKQLDKVIKKAIAALGGIDILVNNVGASVKGNILSLPENSWKSQFQLNLNYVYDTMRLVLPTMIEQGGGSIVNISSIAGVRCLESEAVAYATAKAALIQLGRSTAISFGSQGVRVNTVIPGLMNTPLVASRLADFDSTKNYAEIVEERNKKVPLGQMGDAWDVAHAVAFLSSERAKSITATEILVDGGLTACC